MSNLIEIPDVGTWDNDKLYGDQEGSCLIYASDFIDNNDPNPELSVLEECQINGHVKYRTKKAVYIDDSKNIVITAEMKYNSSTSAYNCLQCNGFNVKLSYNE